MGYESIDKQSGLGRVSDEKDLPAQDNFCGGSLSGFTRKPDHGARAAGSYHGFNPQQVYTGSIVFACFGHPDIYFRNGSGTFCVDPGGIFRRYFRHLWCCVVDPAVSHAHVLPRQRHTSEIPPHHSLQSHVLFCRDLQTTDSLWCIAGCDARIESWSDSCRGFRTGMVVFYKEMQ